MNLLFDCSSGIAGDMTLGAFIGAGVPVTVIRKAIEEAGIDPARLQVSTGLRQGITGVDVTVTTEGAEETHDHVHYSDIVMRLEQLSDERTRQLAQGMFLRVARAEGKIHGVEDLQHVAFHEVGAIDSFVDIVGVAACFAHLRPERVYCARVTVGHGTVKAAHGFLPLPSPAAMEILREVPAVLYQSPVASELCTPTGAAILAECVTDWGRGAEGKVTAIGYGCGDKELEDRPNVLRISCLETRQGDEEIVHLETNLDDMTGEQLGSCLETLLTRGALDAWWVPATMKSSRPGGVLNALVRQGNENELTHTMFRESSSLGIRRRIVERTTLERRFDTVETQWGSVQVKIGMLNGEVINVAPEFSQCQALAAQAGQPVKLVYETVQARWYGQHS